MDGLVIDPIEAQRREKVKDAMLHAWTSYETYAWGHDELQVIFQYPVLLVAKMLIFVNILLCQPQSKNGVDSFGGLGATLIDSLDTLYIMGLDEQFQKAREYVPLSIFIQLTYTP